MRSPTLIALGIFIGFHSQIAFAGNTHNGKIPQIVYWQGDANHQKIALTFDDGPHPEYTGRILDILAEKNVKATFFVTGKRVEKYPELARRIVSDGHVIGNHGYSHHEMKLMSRKRIREEIRQGQSVIREVTGESTTIFRPPYGMFSRAVVAELREAGHRLIQWSLSPKDWAHPREQVIVKRVLTRARSGSIILLHDSHPHKESGNREQTVKALPKLIDALQSKGFYLVTVPDLLKAEPSVLATSDILPDHVASNETVVQ